MGWIWPALDASLIKGTGAAPPVAFGPDVVAGVGGVVTVIRLAFVLLVATVASARAQVPVDVALVLALDSSASVDEREFAIQRGGLADAFRDPEVVRAIMAGPLKRIAVTVMEWAEQVVDIPWIVVEDAGSANLLADRIDGQSRSIPTGATSIAGALRFASSLLRTAPVDGTRLVIDISGDGRNNQGQPVDIVRRAVVAQGVTINGLAIVNEHPTLNYYFEDRVIGGPAAFVEIANNYADYPRAIRRKLIREIRTLSVSEGRSGSDRRQRLAKPAASEDALSGAGSVKELSSMLHPIPELWPPPAGGRLIRDPS